MSNRKGMTNSFRATQSIGVFLVVSVPATTSAFNCELADTATSRPLGIIQDNASTNTAADVVVLGRSLALASASISAGALLSWVTATAQVVAVTNTSFGAALIRPTIGIALQAGTAASHIEIFVNPNYNTNMV